MKFLKCASMPKSDAVPLLEVGSTLTMCCSHVYMFFFGSQRVICYLLSAATLVCFEVRYVLSACWPHCRVFPSALKFWPLNLHIVWLPSMTISLRFCFFFLFFYLPSVTSEISAFFSYGESGIDGDRQSRGPLFFFILSS